MYRICTSSLLFILAFARCDCMGDTINYKPFQLVSNAQFRNRNVADGEGGVNALISNANGNYAMTRRTQLAISGDDRNRDATHQTGPTITDGLQLNIEPGSGAYICTRKVDGQTAGGARRIVAWVRLKSDSTSNQLDLFFRYGPFESTKASVESTSYGWHRLELDTDPIVERQSVAGRVFTLWVANEGTAAETVEVESVTIFEATDGASDHVDLSSATGFAADQPLSPAHLQLLNGNVNDTHRRYAGRPLFSHSWDIGGTSTTSSAAVIIRRAYLKPTGATALTFKYRVSSGSQPVTYQAKTYTIPGGVLTASSGTIVVAANTTRWLDLALTVPSAESEQEIRIEASSPFASSQASHCFALIVTPTADTFAGLPSEFDTQPDDAIMAREFDRIRALDQYTRNRNAPILISDYQGEKNPPSNGFVYRVDGTGTPAPTYETLFHGLLYPTHGARFLVAEVDLKKQDQTQFRQFTYSAFGGTLQVGQRYDFIDATGARVAEGRLLTTTGGASGTAWFFDWVGSVQSGEVGSVGGGANTITASSDDSIPGASDGDLELYFKIVRDTGTGSGISRFPTTTTTPVAEQVVNVNTRPYGARWRQKFRVPIDQDRWNDATYDGSNFPYVYTLIARSTRSGVTCVVDSVRIGNAVVYEEIPPYLQDGSE
jgi:hypothetical protein